MTCFIKLKHWLGFACERKCALLIDLCASELSWVKTSFPRISWEQGLHQSGQPSLKPLMVQAESLLIKAPSHQDVGAVGGQITRILRLLSVLKFTRILLFLEAIFFIQFLSGFGTHFKLKWASPFLTPMTPSNSSSPYARFILNAKLIFIASFSFWVTLHWNLT